MSKETPQKGGYAKPQDVTADNVIQGEDKPKKQNTQVPEKDKKKGCCTCPPPPTPEEKRINALQNKIMVKMVCQQIWWILLATPFMFIGAVNEFLFPMQIANITNALIGRDWDLVLNELLIWFIIIMVGSIGLMLNTGLFGLVAEKIGHQIRKDLFKRVITLDTEYFDETTSGQILSRLTNDTQVLQEGLSMSVSMFVKAAAINISMLVIMFIYSWKLTIYAVLLIMPSALGTRIFYSCFEQSNKNYQNAKSGMAGVALETFGNVRTVKAFATERIAIDEYKVVNQQVYQKGMEKAYVYGGFYFTFTVFQSSAFACIMYIVSVTFEQEKLDVGKAMAYLLYMRKIVDTFGEMMNAVQQIARVMGASKQIARLLVTPNKVVIKNAPEGQVNKMPEGHIEMTDVKFNYPTKKDVQVLNGVHIDIPANTVVAFVGASGCGKSSVMKLIERFYDPQEGALLYDGINIKDLDNAWYHQDQLAIVQQEPALFSNSIRDNIMYGCNFDHLSAEEIEERYNLALKQANVGSFLWDEKLFPEGDKTLVGERGVKLSGGQKQRIAIARALIRQPRVLLLDEATSALDSESEHQVQQALDTLMDGAQRMTVVVIAHRLSTIRNASNIIVLSKGHIAEQGTHDDLVARKGAYHKLVERQLLQIKMGEEIQRGKLW